MLGVADHTHSQDGFASVSLVKIINAISWSLDSLVLVHTVDITDKLISFITRCTRHVVDKTDSTLYQLMRSWS